MKNILQIISIVLIFNLSAYSQTRIYTPVLKAPEDVAINQMPDALLDWDAVTGEGVEISYDVQLAQSPDFSDAVSFNNVTVTALNMTKLNFKELYYWRVRAHDGIATSDWSAAWSFYVVSTVTITSPANQSTQNPDPLVKWNTLTGVTQYEIQVDTAYSWRIENSGITTKLSDVFVVDANDTWAVGDAGVILHRTNGAWNSIESGVTANLTDVFFLDASHGWAAGESGTVLFYDGSTWTAMASGVTTTLNSLFFTSATNGYAVGNTGTSIHFDGTTWSNVVTGVTVDLYGIHGLDAQHIWAVGKTGKYSYFNGVSWVSGTVSTRDLLSVWAVSTDKVWIPSKAGKIYFWDGSSWSEQVSGSTKDLYDVCFLDENNGYIVGKSGTLLYYNGAQWKSTASGISQDLNSINIKDAATGFIVGNTGSVVAFQGEGFNSPYRKEYHAPGTILEFRFSNLLFGQTHYFRMRASHEQDTSDWSPANSFFVVAKPTLKTPVSNSVEIALDTLAKWEVLTGVVKYGIQLSTDEIFTDPLYFESSIGEYRFQDLIFGQDYYWRVNARHAGDISAWSDANKFTTINTVSLISPEDNAVDLSLLPKYTWNEIRGTEKYMIQIAQNNNFVGAESNIVTIPEFQTQFLLEKNTEFFWKVIAIQGLDSTNWSPTRSYTTSNGTSIPESKSQAFILFPNPSNGEMNLVFTVGNAELVKVEVFNLLGNSVFEDSFMSLVGEVKKNYDLRGTLKKGVYLVRLVDSKKVYTQKLTIE
jgi:photosystem II stability/assembly factor-like uncharacterized protein